MSGGRLIRRARVRARVSQAELARRLATQQPVVARWESGARSPSFETVARAVGACGFTLDAALSERDAGEDALILEWLKLSPAERLRRNEQMLATERWARRARRVDERGTRARG